MKSKKNNILFPKVKFHRLPKALAVFVLSLVCVLSCASVVNAQDSDMIEEGRKGVVEIFAGFVDQGKNFIKIKSVSGCLICNESGQVNILTNYHNVHITEKERKAYAQKQKMEDSQLEQFDEGIRVVLKGDILSEAAVVLESEQQDFCVLKIDEVMNDRSAFVLGDASDLKAGSAVYVLGFPEKASLLSEMKYEIEDVLIFKGEVQRTDERTIFHSALVTGGNNGGALLDEDGHIIGLNNEKYTDSEGEIYGSVSMETIRDSMDDFGIQYMSKERSDQFELLEEKYNEAVKLAESGEYQANSLSSLQSAISSAKTVIEEKKAEEESIRSAIDSLSQAEKELVKKISKIHIAQIILGVLCLILLVWLIKLVVWLKKHKVD